MWRLQLNVQMEIGREDGMVEGIQGRIAKTKGT